jgi:H+/Cl- antiporter ClcA
MGDKSKVYKLLSGLNEIKWSIAAKGLMTGVLAGLLVVVYRLGIEYGADTAVKIFDAMKRQPSYIFPWVVIAVAAGCFIAWLIQLEPMASGSGIPQVEGLVLYGLRIKWYSVLAVRFIGGLAASFFGLSLGREGPSIQIGAAGSQAVAEHLSKNKLEENYLITGGAAAGFSAAFNAPISGIIFALEEVHRSFSPNVLIAATTAALTADVVSKYFFGLKPALSFTELSHLPISLYLWLIPLGIVSGLTGSALNKALLLFQKLYGLLPRLLRPSVALLIALPCGLLLPQVLGGGQGIIQTAETAGSGLTALLILFTVKFLFTCTSYGNGMPGGIFLPILSLGALSGSMFGLVAVRFGLPPEYIPVFAVCAMAGALSGSVKAPVTGILLIAEMSGSFVHMLPVAACSFIALFTSDIVKAVPIYEALLERIMNKADKKPQKGKTECLVEVPVEIGSIAAGKSVSEVQWPSGTLIAGIHRGNHVIVPGGNTKILPGDYLVVLSAEHTYQEIHVKIRELCHIK